MNTSEQRREDKKKKEIQWTTIQQIRLTAEGDVFTLLNNSRCDVLLILLFFASIGRFFNLWKRKRATNAESPSDRSNSPCHHLRSARIWPWLPCPIDCSLHWDTRWRRDELVISLIDFFQQDAVASSRHSLPWQCESSLISPSMNRTILSPDHRERGSTASESRNHPR